MAIFYNPDRADVVETAFVHRAITVGTTAIPARALAEKLENRQIVYLFNHGPGTIYWGDADVTTSGANRGVPLAKNQFTCLPFGNLALHVISTVANTQVTIGEVA